MNKKTLIYGAWYAVIAVVIALYTHIFLQPLLSYAEGWNTFYYDKSFVSQVMDNGGVGELINRFLLQFFHHSWHGVAVLTFLTLCLLLFVQYIVKLCTKKVQKDSIRLIVLVVAHIAVLVASTLYFNNKYGRNAMFARLSDMARSEQWDNIVETCKKQSPVGNLLYQNILNMALAEKCELGDRLFEEPVQDIRSIYVDEIQTFEVAALLSDVYYSMGHIAQSQMYAFEANEKVNNLSPRMLQRLVVTNILYGEYNVARKYLYWLSKAIYYRDWADYYTALLNDASVAKNKTLSEKRRCIFPDDRFSGIKGIDDDLLNVARNTRDTRQCQVTLQYLGALYILARYEQQFVDMVKEFGGSKDLPKPLPKCFTGYYDHLTK